MSLVPEAYLHCGAVVFGDPLTGAVLCRGHRVEWPDLGVADDETVDRLDREIRSIHGALLPGEHLQWSIYTGNEFDQPLKRYGRDTSAGHAPAFCVETRQELFNRFWKRKGDGHLLQANARLFLTSKMQPFEDERGRRVKAFDEVFEVIMREFDNRAAVYDAGLSAFGGGVKALDDREHFAEYRRFWSPAAAHECLPEKIDAIRTLQELCCRSNRSPRAADHGFFLGGRYHGVIAFKALPGETGMETMAPLAGLALEGLRVTVNVEALSIGDEIRQRTERARTFWHNVKDAAYDAVSKFGFAKAEEQMTALMSGALKPLRVQVIVTVTDRTRDGLDQKLAALFTLVANLGAEPYQPALWASAYSSFDCATPGYGARVPYPDYRHKIFDLNATHLVPVAGGEAGELDEADVIFDNDANGLCGWKNYAGSQPIATLVVGKTGSGKSVTGQTILAQSAHKTKFLGVIDDGRSYEILCRKLDPHCRPIVVRPNGNLCFNPFDTKREPRSAQQLSDAAALSHLLCGSANDPYRDKIVRGTLLEHIESVYDSAYEGWRKAEPARYADACRGALTLLGVRAAFMKPDDTLPDVFAFARDMKRDDPALWEAIESEGTVDNEFASEAGYKPETAQWVKDFSFSTWRPDEFPRLMHLYDELGASANQGGPDALLCRDLARLLRRWTARYGGFGPIVDGVNNVDLGSAAIRASDPPKVVYVDLGDVGKASQELKAVLGFLIANQLRTLIEQMPRALCKQLVFEELTSFLQVPGGETLISDYFERMRKYKCQLFAIFQQWGSIAHQYPVAAKALRGNCLAKLLFLNNREDLESLAPELPPAVIDRIASFGQPEDMKDDSLRHAAFCHVLLTGRRPRILFGRNFISPALESVVTSSADKFDARQKEAA